MNELSILPDMTKEEAEAKHAELKAIHSVARSMLLEMRDRKGWKALGYASFEEYGEKEWGYTRQHINRLATAYQIEKSLEPIGSKEIPENHLRPLTAIPEAERQAIWDEANRKAEEAGKERTAKMVEEAVAEYKAALEEAQRQVKSWQDDSRDKRHTINDQAQRLKDQAVQIAAIRAPKEKVAYVTDDKKALESIRAVAEAEKAKLKQNLDDAKALAESLRAEKAELLNRQQQAIEQGITARLKDYDDQLQTKQKQEAAILSRIEFLKRQGEDMEARHGNFGEHQKALDDYRRGIVDISVAASVLFNDQLPEPVHRTEWLKQLTKGIDTLEGFRAQVLAMPDVRELI